MTMGHIEDRLAFAEKNIRKTWNNAVFVDECSFLTHTFQKRLIKSVGEGLRIPVLKNPEKFMFGEEFL